MKSRSILKNQKVRKIPKHHHINPQKKTQEAAETANQSNPITRLSKFSTFPYLNLPEKSSRQENKNFEKKRKNTALFSIIKKYKRKHVSVRKMEQGRGRDQKGRKLPYGKKDREDKIGKEKGVCCFFEKNNIKIIF